MGKVLALVGVVFASFALVGTALANHSWGGYHWSRSANPLVLSVGDNVDSRWEDNLSDAITDWNKSSVLQSEHGLGRDESSELWSERLAGWKSAMARTVPRAGSASRRSGSRQAATSPRRRPSSTTRTSNPGVQHGRLATPRHVSGDRARLRARSPGRELQQSEPRHVHGLHERPQVGRAEQARDEPAPEPARLRRARHDLLPSRRLGRGRRQALPREEVLERSRRRPVVLAGQQGERRRVRRPPAERGPPTHARVLGARLETHTNG